MIGNFLYRPRILVYPQWMCFLYCVNNMNMRLPHLKKCPLLSTFSINVFFYTVQNTVARRLFIYKLHISPSHRSFLSSLIFIPKFLNVLCAVRIDFYRKKDTQSTQFVFEIYSEQVIERPISIKM